MFFVVWLILLPPPRQVSTVAAAEQFGNDHSAGCHRGCRWRRLRTETHGERERKRGREGMDEGRERDGEWRRRRAIQKKSMTRRVVSASLRRSLHARRPTDRRTEPAFHRWRRQNISTDNGKRRPSSREQVAAWHPSVHRSCFYLSPQPRSRRSRSVHKYAGDKMFSGHRGLSGCRPLAGYAKIGSERPGHARLCKADKRPAIQQQN